MTATMEKPPAKAAAKPSTQKTVLRRETFHTSREMDFFSEKQLVIQTGHEFCEWPLVIVKELIDNALDACEDANVAPVIEATVDGGGIAVTDNGPGLPEDTLEGVLDFSVRVSSREAYVSPCRGAQGNALKTLLAMPSVIDPDEGRLVIEAHGRRQHVITCRPDPISQRATVRDDATDLPKSKNPRLSNGSQLAVSRGTSMRMEWSANFGKHDYWLCDDPDDYSTKKDRLIQLVTGFAVFNPHATIRLNWFGKKSAWIATEPTWAKWRPCQPTSAHWYALPHIERLIGAYITRDRARGTDRLVSDFVAEFDGLSGSGKRTKVLEDAGLKRAKLSELVRDECLDGVRIGQLLDAMQQHSRPVKSERLGVLGEDHLRSRLLAMGVKAESFRYCRRVGKPEKVKTADSARGEASCLPWVLESAFGYLGHDWRATTRRLYAGVNWSAAIANPFRRFGGATDGLETMLGEQYAGGLEPIVFVLHLAHPRPEYTDRGKSAIVIGG